MNPDIFSDYVSIDSLGMLAEIHDLPNQLKTAWSLGTRYDLPEETDFKTIIIAGMGGSAIGADIVSAYAFNLSKIPIMVLRGYDLPEFVSGKQCLVVCSSHSGNTEETISIFDQAINRRCTVLTITTGGLLEARAKEQKTVHWKFEHNGQPRAAVGYSFGLIYCLLSRLSIISDEKKDIDQVISTLEKHLDIWDVNISAARNLPKRIAGQAIGRISIFFGAEHLEPVARRWKTQLNELAKSIAGFEFLPEADHNALAGLDYPEKLIDKFYSVFLNSKYYHLKNNKRIKLTAQEYMVSGICTDQIILDVESKLVEIWTMVLLGDFVSYYLAIAYREDPTPIERLDNFKKAIND
jgi:glucose/mannose-6-phosphate isomerase